MKIFLLSIFLTLSSCGLKNENVGKEEKKEDSINIVQNVETPIDSITAKKLDKILDNDYCDNNYIYYDGYFYYPDYGCLYAPSKHNLGNSYVFLIPKENIINSNSSFEFIEKEEKKLDNTSIEEIKEKYLIAIFLIEAKYLKYMPDMEIPYYQKFPYKEKYIRYDSNLKKWILVKEFDIMNFDDEQKMNQQMWNIVEDLGKR